MSLFLLITTHIPRPELAQSPDITEQKPIVPFIYNIIIATDIAQFGIKPKIAAAVGPRIEFDIKYLPKASAEPHFVMAIFITKVIKNINMLTLIVCMTG